MEVRFLNVQEVPEERLQRWESWLDGEKCQRLAKMGEKARLLSLCGDGLSREMLSRRLGCRPEELSFTGGPHGKPCVAGAYFNCSHSGDYVACVVAGREVGVDIERVRAVPRHLGERLTGWQTEEDFFRRWTELEAAIKCLGEGIAAWQKVNGEAFRLLSPTAPDGYVATIALKK